jgi:hypothetical protein
MKQESNMNHRHALAGAMSFALGFASVPSTAAETDDVSFKELSAQWWQWAMSIPAAVNPLVDDTGAFCMVGQRGPVWFLAGNLSGTPVQRTCTVPQNVTLFFPVLNIAWINTPACDGFNLTVSEARAVAAQAMDGATGLSVTLDGKPLKIVRRVASEVFPTVFPPGSVFGGTCPVPGDIYSPSVGDGYYAKIGGLSAGQHVLRFRGTNAGGTFTIDVTYTLKVVAPVLK